MLKFVLKKFLTTITVIFSVITLTFFLINLTHGNPFSVNKTTDSETLKNLYEMYGLNKPIFVRYFEFLKGLTHLDFGLSYKYIGIPVSDLIFAKGSDSGFWLSMKYGSIVFVIVFIFGTIIGVLSAIKKKNIFDDVINLTTVLGFSIPSIIIGPLLIQLFGVKLKWFPTCQWGFDFQHLFLPVLTLSISLISLLSQVQKMSLIDVLNSKFVQMAKAKGLPRKRIILKHSLRPAFLAVVSYLGSTVSSILSGTVIVERLFSLPGLGNLTINAAISKDYSMILALIIIYSTLLISFNTISDILYVIIDPRIKTN